jgi:hypothetical protein
MIEAYFDESGSHDGSPVLCVAGYLFETDRCKELDLLWQDTLNEFGLPFFHMVDCAHGAPPFDKLSPRDRDAVARKMIGLIRSHALFGVAVGVDERDYNEILPPALQAVLPNDGLTRRLPGSAYSFCCSMMMAAVQSWVQRNSFDGTITYFFEAGHKHQRETSEIMERVYRVPEIRHRQRYASHVFVTKECCRPAQSADILAWHHAADLKKLMTGGNRRKDFAALIEGIEMELKFVARSHLLHMREQINRVTMGRTVMVGGTFGTFRFETVV